MTDSQITQMCDDFYQADSGSSRFAGGLGLGLPIARGLLHAMGGFIYFDSSGQQGLQVHITIPQGVRMTRRLWQFQTWHSYASHAISVLRNITVTKYGDSMIK